MSTNVFADQAVSLDATPTVQAAGKATWGSLVGTILTPLASLKLTVFLLIVSTFVTWLATMEQTRVDFWTVKQKHFPELFVFIPFQILFPPAWFPTLQNLPEKAGFFVPSGFLLIVAMLVNLTAAHALRIRVQARGSKLAWGLIISAIGAVVTWLVIFNGQNPNGFQAEPPISYRTMWILMQLLLLGLAVGLGVSATLQPREKQAERIIAASLGAILLLTIGFVWWIGDRAFIGESAMRILWQLLQSTIAALAVLAGTQLLFRRKGGIVLVHLGIAMLMINELYVTLTNVEQRMAIAEGETVSHAVDIRGSELVIADSADREAVQLTTLPASLWKDGQLVKDDQLPFRVRCLRFESNTDIAPVGSGQNLATKGIGQRFEIQPKRVTAGTDSQQVADMAGAYLQLEDKETGADLGTWMVSQILYEEGMFDEVEVGGKKYLLGLRFRHYYKPYEIKLIDAIQENYIGTSTPRHFESKFVMTDKSRGIVDLEKRVYMNNPMRYGDETFYQASMSQLPSGREYTVLQIVKNRGWMIPYVACMFVVVGLLAQFGTVLLGYLDKRAAASASTVKLDLSQTPGKTGAPVVSPQQVGWGIPLICLGLALGYVGYAANKAAREKVSRNGMELDRLGTIPIVHKGRVQPLESLARNTARQMGNRETVALPGGKRVPAMQWFADLIFDPASDAKYQIIRIEDPELLKTLGLPAREGLKYTLAEVNAAREPLDRLLDEIRERKEEERTASDKRTVELTEKLNQLKVLRDSMSDPALTTVANPFQRLIESSQLVSLDLPLAVRTADPSLPWTSIRAAIDTQWLQDLANQHMCGTVDELSQTLLEEYWLKPQIIERLLRDPDLLQILKAQSAETNPEILRKQIESRWDQFPKQIYQAYSQEIEIQAERSLGLKRGEFTGKFKAMVRDFAERNGGESLLTRPLPEMAKDLTGLQRAYVAGDAEEFNSIVTRQLARMKELETPTGNWRGLKAELFYNRFAPFYLAMLLYLFALVLTIASWTGFGETFRRAALSVNGLALAVQIVGIILRIVISGRPPITNLYGSFLVIPAFGVILLMLVERFTRLGIGNLLASVTSFVSLLWAWTISIPDGDTFAVLVAVLDTQFWLSTHVICISFGYAATMVAGFLGMVWLVDSVLLKRMAPASQKTLSDLIYGITCFALLLSFFGTVLGGLWADDSWGRFWGWDPKENGALMIVLWNAAILHARWAGIARQHGIAAMAVLGCAVTIWSWEGVNQLGIGMHSYGFSEGRLFWVAVFALSVNLFAAASYLPRLLWGEQKSIAS